MMNERGKSGPAVVAAKLANKAERSAAEPVEPRAGTKGNANQQHTGRTQSRETVSQVLARIRQTARNSDLPSLTRGRSRMRESRTYGSVRGGGEQSPSLPRPTWAVQQIGGYWGYTGRAANVIVRAAIGRLGAPQCGTLQPRDGANVSAGSTEAGPEAPRLESQLRSDPQADAGKVAGGWTNDFLRGDGLRHGNPVLACTPALKDVLWDTMDVSGSR